RFAETRSSARRRQDTWPASCCPERYERRALDYHSCRERLSILDTVPDSTRSRKRALGSGQVWFCSCQPGTSALERGERGRRFFAAQTPLRMTSLVSWGRLQRAPSNVILSVARAFGPSEVEE